MYLKSLEVHGFKSFANKLIFEFHDGITAIVGPNGSGKSNVADAVRWVLGEQSARQLRGAKMEDVIFAGTELRKPLGYAYVAITINNEDHKLNVPYSEVKIARRVYRSGESEYLLNGAACRLKDVQELLFDTGIGKEGYSIIGQGQIDKILSGKPEDRRELFDEAAGIVKYKKRKAAAEKNLEEERNNLVRIEDILSELTKQVEPLKNQSEKAKEYLKYRDELKVHDVNMFFMEYEQVSSEIKETDTKKAIADNDLKEAQAAFETCKSKFEELEKQMELKDKLLEEEREKLSAKKVSLNNYENDVRILEEKINAIRQSEFHYKERMKAYHDRIITLSGQISDYEKEQSESRIKLSVLEKEQSENQEQSKQIAKDIAEIEKVLDSYKNDMLSSANEAAGIKTEEQKIKTLIEQNNIKKAELTKQILTNKSEAVELEEIMAKEKSVYEDITEKIHALEASLAEFRNTVSEIDKEYSSLVREHTDTQQKFHMDNSRLNSLRNMTERYEGFGQSIKRVMEQKERNKGIIGVVADIIRVKKEYELAVETALGGSIQNIVTDNEQTAKNMIQFLKKNKFGRATFLPLTNVHAKAAAHADNIMSEEGVIGMASSLVEADDKFSGLVQYLLGRFVVVDHIDHAIALANKYHHTIRIVTTEGDLLNPGGSMSGGAFKNNNNLLGRRREMEDLESRVRGLKDKIDELAVLIKDKEKQKQDIDKKISDSDKIRNGLVLQQNTAKLRYDRAALDLNKNQEGLERLRFDARQIENSGSELTLSMNQITSRLSDNDSKNKKFEDEIENLNQKLAEAQKKEEHLREESSRIMLEKASCEQNIQFHDENIKRTGEELTETKKNLSEADENSQNTDVRIDEKKAEIAEVEIQIARTKAEIEEIDKLLDTKKQEKEELSSSHKKVIEERENLSEHMSGLDKECFRLESQKEKLSERIDVYTNYMWEQYELTYHTALELQTETQLSRNDIKKRISELKADIKALGNVNVNAIEQYKELMERHDLLSTQHEDLIKAADVLVGIIEELDTEMRKQFESQFGQIKQRFDHVFKELFGGGRGTLELTEDDDILTAGIKIVAQPPGKKLQNMMQLSGGEKALTAIALLFAIQSLKPSPFCLLDEIEAALDDSNVDRYAQYLHKLTKDTQFIVITHRRGTMNKADILYGITMQEKGVSTLVSVNLLDEKELT